ncbi:4-(cytidine 5'-diphospho)-2-C-methyl-D-erythritol kinase [Pusillimonas caeni]|uniref:4-(cytidine 5'-diphospho)-2-C-methyl-D-erythritol kinase n=1 Tax=Pusillimonas caeni TaxID=1348472 RepID=UPI000E59D4DC|nr:4-(cytidine 5'-diphospho)-2-C-methyl-D-erythritol kinase [Pusillimonas caeni]TFL15241.1 4-(cytidine 5'-diphospho)-2-C-methyl-D-erythritol kinase [Pusillimonas caeni]
MRLYDVPAPAKLNLFLHVTGRREDGYHLLQTAFRFVDLCDTLHFERRGDGLIACDNALPGLRAEEDLIVRAARALQQAAGIKWGAQISCEKRIPAGGGLGGGSSNAATALIALNRLWDTGLSRRQLMELALPLGADVPVFVFGRPAFAEGVGEVLTDIELPERAYLIARPAQHVSTPHVFTDPGLTRDTKSIKITVFADWQLEQQAKQMQAGQIQGMRAGFFGRNDLEPVVRARYPTVEKALAFLAEHGIPARMTGSGACVFAEFVTYDQAVLNQQKIIGKIPYCGDTVPVIDATWACHGLLDHPLRYWTKD